MIIWDDPKIVPVNGGAELCWFLGFLENKRNLENVGGHLKSEKWDDPKLNPIFLGGWVPQDLGCGSASVRSAFSAIALSLGSLAVMGVNQ